MNLDWDDYFSLVEAVDDKLHILFGGSIEGSMLTADDAEGLAKALMKAAANLRGEENS